MANYIGIDGLVFSQDDTTAVVNITISPEAVSPVVLNSATTQSAAIWLKDASKRQIDDRLDQRMTPLYDYYGKAALQAWLAEQNGG